MNFQFLSRTNRKDRTTETNRKGGKEMAEVKTRYGGTEEDRGQEQQIDNKLDFIKSISGIRVSIRDKVKEDFVYAKLRDKDKTAVIEMTANAYYSQKLIGIIRAKARNWEFNSKEQKWERRPITKRQDELIEKYAEALFDSFMTRVYMVVIMNRNVKDNHLIRLLLEAGETKEEEAEEETEEKESIIQRLGRKVKTKRED